MSITDLVTALQSHNYLALFILLALYARKLSGPDSKCPINIPPTWAPTVTAAFGLVYGVLASRQSGLSWGEAALNGFVTAGSTGFLDGMLTAIFNHGNAPSWARAIVFIVDDITGKTPPAPGNGSQVQKIPEGLPKAPPAAMFVALACLLIGCAKPLPPLPPNTPADVQQEVDCILGELFQGQTDVAVIATACTSGDLALASDLIQWLLSFASVRAKMTPANIQILQKAPHHADFSPPPGVRLNLEALSCR